MVGECLETKPSSFEEAVQQPVWVDAMVEEYDSIIQNSVWDVVPRSKDNSDGLEDPQMDVKTAFLNGKIKEEVYIEQLIDSYFTGLGFIKSEANANLYHIMVEGKPLIIVLFVDDLILTGDDQLINSCKEDLAREFEMKDMGLMHYFLGMEVWQKDGKCLCLKANMPMRYSGDSTWRSASPCRLLYQVTGGRRMLLQLSQAMVYPTKLFWMAAKHLPRYVGGTSQYGLWYRRTEGAKLQGFTDVDWAGSPSVRKRTLGGIFNLGSAAVSWYRKKQRSVALSSAEVEYMAASQVACEAIWMRKILVGLFDQRMDPTVIYYNNQSCIKLSENPVFHDRSKHIDFGIIIFETVC
eukprot:PITA_34424